MNTGNKSCEPFKTKPIYNPFSNQEFCNGFAKQKKRQHRSKQYNAPRWHFNRQAGLALFLFVTGASIWFLTPVSTFISRIILQYIPIQEDIALGLESWREMSYRYPLVNVRHYDRWGVKSIGTELANVLRVHSEKFCSKIDAVDVFQCRKQMKEYRWSFEIVSSGEINAFALPGGIIRVTDSLLDRLHLTKGEISGLLGHEMGHVLFRHSQARLLKGNLLEMVLKALVYDDKDERQESFGEAVGELLLNGAKFLGEMRFSRQDEYEADGAAFDILSMTDMYDPRAVQSLLEKLWSLNDDGGQDEKGMLGFLQGWDKTHPGTQERIEALSKRWDHMSHLEKIQFRGRLR